MIKQVVFRVLAGLLSIAFGVLLVFGDVSKMSHFQIAGTVGITVVFGVYALMGGEQADRTYVAIFGGAGPKAH